MKPSNRVVNSLLLQVVSLGLALAMVPAVTDDAVPRSALSKNTDVSRMSGMNCSGVAATPTKVVLPLGKSTMVRLPGPVSNRTLGNPNIAQAMLVSPESLYLLGMSIGTTNMILQEKNGSCSVIDVEVTMDPEALMQTFRELFPDEKNIRITAAADSLVLSGVVSDALVVSQVVDLATAYVRRPATTGASPQDGMNLPLTPVGLQQQTANAAQAGARVINLLSVGSAQQVMLEVKIAEVSKTLIDKLGTGVQGSIGGGAWTYSILSRFLTGTLSGNASATRSTGARLTLEAEKKMA